jgi:hypothetical protein
MKLRIFLIANVLFFTCLVSFSQSPISSTLPIQKTEEHEYDTVLGHKLLKYDSIIKRYKVTKIKRLNNAYLIGLTDVITHRYLFTLISLKTNKQDGKKIRKGKQYDFLLYSYYGPKVHRIMGDPRTIKRYFIIEGISVVFTTNPKTGNIVTTPNLNGLYYTKHRENE